MRIARAVQLMTMVAGASLFLASLSGAQAPITKSAVVPNIGAPKITTFTPIDSFFVNPTVSTFTIALVHTLSGMAPSEYRVSRFADFRDANWLPYASRPSTTVQSSQFTAGSASAREMTLHLQVRARNPRAGQPTSINGGTTQVQPDFFFSDVAARRIRIVLAG